MKVIVCGGRNYQDYDKVCEVLSSLDITEVVVGDATGADYLARKWAIANGVDVTLCVAYWDIWGKAAGPRRNQAMLRMHPKLVIAFPGGRGTADMVGRAKKAGTKVLEVK